MKSLLKKSLAFLTGSMFLLCAYGCDEKKEYSDEADKIGSMAQEDLPYGATITQLKPSYDENVKIAMEYDNRFLTVEEAMKLSDYVAALNNSDGELLSNTFYKPLLDKICDNSQYDTVDEYIAATHDNIRDSYIGYDFSFDYILVSNCLTEKDDDSETGFSSIDSTLASLDESIVDKITDRKMVTFDIEYRITNEEGGSYMLSSATNTDSTLYIYTIDGEIYIV